MPELTEGTVIELPPDEVSADLARMPPIPKAIEEAIDNDHRRSLELQQALDDLADIQASIAKTSEEGGAISNETIASLESICPGMLTDNYPPGGYSGDKIKIAMEEISFRQGILLGGVIAAIISVIIGIVKFLSMFFKDSSSATQSVSHKAKQKVDEISEDVKAIKENDREIDKFLPQLSDESKIDAKNKRRLIDFINAQLQTKFDENTRLTDIIKKAEKKMDEDIATLIGGITNTISLEINAKRFSGTFMTLNVYVIKHLSQIIDNIQKQMDYAYKIQRANASTEQVRILEENKQYEPHAGFRDIQVKTVKALDTRPIYDATRTVMLSAMISQFYGSVKERPIQGVTLDAAEKFAKDIAAAMDMLTLPDESKRIGSINDIISKIADENVVLEREGNNVDKKTAVIIKGLLEGARDELVCINKLTNILIANKCLVDLNSTLNTIHRPIRHKRKVQEHILKFQVKYGFLG